MVDNFNNFLSRGEIRKKADELLDRLSVSYLNNLASDYRDDIIKSLNDVKNSNIDWGKDVVKSVRVKYKQLTNSKTISDHMNKW